MPIPTVSRRAAAAWLTPLLLLAPFTTAGADDAPKDAPKVDPASIEVETDLPDLIMAHNRERAEQGKPAVEFDPLLAEAAAIQARDMAAHGKMTHEGSDGSTPPDRVERVGYKFQSTAENVAMGYREADAVIKGWMDSPKHRDNILGNFAEIGLAKAIAPDGTPYWAAVFGRPWPELDPETAAGDLIAAVNQARAEAGKTELKPHTKLQQAASQHARANAEREQLASKDPDGKTPLDRVAESGYRYRLLGQADASGQPRAADVLETWLDSEDQKKQLLGEFTDAGAGYATDESGKPYWTLILGRRR